MSIIGYTKDKIDTLLGGKADTAALAPVATSGAAADLTGTVADAQLPARLSDASLGAAYAPLVEAVSVVAASGAAQTIDLASGSMFDLTLTAACTVTLPTPAAGRSFTLRLRQDATGGRLVTWSGTVHWPGGASPTLTATASAIDDVAFTCWSGSSWTGYPAGYDIR